MINIWMSIVTWTVNLLGLVLFCAHPDFRTVKFTRMRILMWVVLGVVYMGCSGLMLALHIPVPIIAAILLLGWALWRRIKKEEVFIEGMFRGLIWIGVVLTMEIGIMYYRLGRDAFFVPDFHDPVLSLPLSYVILIGFAQLYIRQIALLRKETNETIRLSYLIMAVLQIPACLILIMILRDVRLQQEDGRFTIMIAITYYLFNVIPLITGLFMRRKTLMERNAQIYLNQYEYYLQMESEHRRVRRIYHDLKNQIMFLQNHAELVPESIRLQADAAEKELHVMDQFYHTGQKDLDILLFNFRRRAEKEGIRFEATVSENSLNFIEASELNTLFLNALNNAVEACEKISEGERFIEVKAGAHLNDVLIMFRNSANPQRDIGSLRTSKEDKMVHGLGIPSIRRIAKKYNGYVDFKETDSSFQMVVLFVNLAEQEEEAEPVASGETK